MENKKYPTFQSFLERLVQAEFVPKSGSAYFNYKGEKYYYQLHFLLVGMNIKIIHSNFSFEECRVVSSFDSGKRFVKDKNHDHVIDMAIEWIYKKYFQYGINETHLYKVYSKVKYREIEIYQPDFLFIGEFNALNYEELSHKLLSQGYILSDLIIEKQPYKYDYFKNLLDELDLN